MRALRVFDSEIILIPFPFLANPAPILFLGAQFWRLTQLYAELLLYGDMKRKSSYLMVGVTDSSH